MEFNQQLYKKRQRSNAIGLTLSLGAMALGLFVLLWILSVLLSNGFAALDWNMFTQSTPAPGSDGGGLANAIVGSLLMVGFTVLVSTPIGVLAGVYLAEYGDQSKTAELTRFVTDIMLSAPSIVLGLFVYAIAVATVGNFSGWAGSLALSLIAVPVVVRTTENMLRLVPGSLREAAFALGAPRWKVSTMVTLRAARSGVMTGLLLAVARISGETAPLLFTALNNQFFSTNMNAPMANLPVVIFQFALSPYENWVRLAWGGALLITLSVLILNVVARVFLREKNRELTMNATATATASKNALELRNLSFFYGNLYPGQRAEGSISFYGQDILDPKQDINLLRARIGMVFQKPTPFPMSIYDNIAFGVKLYETLSKSEMDDRVEWALSKAALWTEIEELIDELKHDYTIAIVTHNMQQAARCSDFTAYMYLGEMIEFGATEQIFFKPERKETEDYITGRFG
eukprot:gene3471-3516_t